MVVQSPQWVGSFKRSTHVVLDGVSPQRHEPFMCSLLYSGGRHGDKYVTFTAQNEAGGTSLETPNQPPYEWAKVRSDGGALQVHNASFDASAKTLPLESLLKK